MALVNGASRRHTYIFSYFPPIQGAKLTVLLYVPKLSIISRHVRDLCV
jgi:hypothetical protein